MSHFCWLPTPLAYITRAVAYIELGKSDEAKQDYGEAIRLDPQDASAYTGRGGLYLRIGEYERAVLDNEEAIRLNPKYPLAYVNRALAYTYLGKDKEASQDVKRVGELGIGSTLMTAFEASIEESKKRR